MPIKKENMNLYPSNWEDIRKEVLDRAESCCEFCGVRNYEPHPLTGSKVILTVAHLDHQPQNCDYSNSKSHCQFCHNSSDNYHPLITQFESLSMTLKNGDIGTQTIPEFKFSIKRRSHV